MEIGMDLNHGKTWPDPKDLGEGENIDHREKSQRQEKREKKEMGKILLNGKKNVWAFFCHMDYCKD